MRVLAFQSYIFKGIWMLKPVSIPTTLNSTYYMCDTAKAQTDCTPF